VSKLRDHVPRRNGKANGAATSDAAVVVEGFAGTGLHGFEARRRERDLSSHSTPATRSASEGGGVDNDAEMAAALAAELNGDAAASAAKETACPSCASSSMRAGTRADSARAGTFLQSSENDACQICEQPMR